MKIHRYPLILLLFIVLLSGCSPKSSYMVLSFFFDGVPDYTKKEAHHNPDSTKILKSPSQLVASLPVKQAPEIIYHKPFAERNCNACHDKGVNNRSLREQPDMCYGCHKNFNEKFTYVHGPVAGGYCSSCHYPHQGTIAKLLKRHGQQLCLHCHSISQVLLNTAHANIGNSDCTVCHDPHGGANRFVLK